MPYRAFLLSRRLSHILLVATLFVAALFFINTAVLPNVSAAATDSNQFVISSYDIAYTLSKDDSGHSRLDTVETITAQFPEKNQNHGLLRVIPSTYKNHPTHLKISSVTDKKGDDIPYHTDSQNDTLQLKIGEKNSYAHGEKTYVISYSQRDVTHFFEDTDRSEFYWDTNGTGWAVPIKKLSVSLTLADGLTTQQTGDAACYQGKRGSRDKCNLTSKDQTTYTASASDLAPYENMTIALGFSPHTFAEYEPSLFEKFVAIWKRVQLIIVPIAILYIIWTIISCYMVYTRSREQKPIITEYVPPANTSVAASAYIMPPASGQSGGLSAQVIDLAVRHYIQIIETKPKKNMFIPAEYAIKVIKPITELKEEEQKVLRSLFGRTPEVGQKLSLISFKNNRAAAKRIFTGQATIREIVAKEYHLRGEVSKKDKKRYNKISLFFAILSVITLSPVLLIITGINHALLISIKPLTDEGLSLLRYLKGLKQYIKTAEVERIKLLQSPDGAEKSGIAGDDSSQVLRLYERLLPYAILFGQEKKWNDSLGRYYETTHTQPGWYSSPSSAAFNGAVLSDAMSGITNSISSTVYSSSSSGGSTGGGFSGGGGGGGGGGGW